MEKIKAYFVNGIIFSNSSEAKALYQKSHFGEPNEEKIQYSLSETLYLTEKGKMELYSKIKKIPEKEIINKFRRIDQKISLKYPVFKNLRDKGYIVKTALKFGAEFRVYDKNVEPGTKNKHAKWIVFTENETKKMSWHEFSAKNRVAHSTKKNLLLAIIDEEGDISYYEVKWIKP